MKRIYSKLETSWIIAAILALLLIPIYLMARKKEVHYETTKFFFGGKFS